MSPALAPYLSATCGAGPATAKSWWRADGTAVDAVGPNGGTLVGGVTTAAGRVGSALSFDGTSGVVAIPFNASYDVPTDGALTVAAWVNTTRAAGYGYQALVIKGGDRFGWDWGIYLDPSNRFMAGRHGAHAVTSTTAAAPNTWYHVALTYANGTWTLYVNGVAEATASGPLIGRSAGALGFGRKGETSLDYYQGRLDEIGFYPRALAVTDVKALAAAGAVSPQPPGTTTTGSDVQVTPTDQTTGQAAPVAVTFESVTAGGTTTVTSAPADEGGTPAPSGFRLGSPATVFDVATTATFAGSITLCFSYAGISFDDESQLRLLHYEHGAWVDITAPGYPNTTTKTVCGTTTSLSPFVVAQQNAKPVVTRVAVPASPVAVGTVVDVTAFFTDADPGDLHTGSFAWQDAISGPFAATEPTATASGSVAASHTYTVPGVYTVTATVSDGLDTDSRASSLDTPAYVVVYDPSGGFVTGGGWILSPANACVTVALCGSTAEGKATFGFVSGYQKGATIPTGNTRFQYHAGSFTFKSTGYEWLVVSGPKAQYKGSGTINGAGDYGFLLTATDGEVAGGGAADRFRIKIWDKTTGATIYDNVPNTTDDTASATQTIGGGSIQIQAK